MMRPGLDEPIWPSDAEMREHEEKIAAAFLRENGLFTEVSILAARAEWALSRTEKEQYLMDRSKQDYDAFDYHFHDLRGEYPDYTVPSIEDAFIGARDALYDRGVTL